jgi:DNA-binding transcriptional MerR regulator
MKIGEASEKTGVSVDTLRYYEKVGLVPAIQRDEHGVRDYTEANLRWVEFVKCMRQAGLPIEALTTYVSLVRAGDETVETRKAILEEQRGLLAERIKEMQRTMLYLDYKIRVYEGTVLKTEKALTEES